MNLVFIDRFFALFPILFTAGAILIFTVLHWGHSKPTYERVENQAVAGFRKRIFEIAYWTLLPMGQGLIRLGFDADRVSWLSLFMGLFAGAFTATGWFGIAGTFLFFSGILDVLDGMVARELGTAGPSGAVLDSVLDRSVDFALHAGAIWLWHDTPILLATALLAAHSSFLMSYSSAMADRERISAPRGIMKRTERGPLILVGLCFSSFSGALEVSVGLPQAMPLAFITATIAIGATYSAGIRVAAVRKALL